MLSVADGTHISRGLCTSIMCYSTSLVWYNSEEKLFSSLDLKSKDLAIVFLTFGDSRLNRPKPLTLYV